MERSRRPDLVSAYAIGVGAGLVALQITWLILNRLTSLVWGPPVGPTVAFGMAVVVGIIVSVIAGRRLARSVDSPQEAANGSQS
jgi:apolipoprotein N-acyltransferase